MNMTALRCPKDNFAKDRRVFRVLFAGTMLRYADVDPVLTIEVIRGHAGVAHLGAETTSGYEMLCQRVDLLRYP